MVSLKNKGTSIISFLYGFIFICLTDQFTSFELRIGIKERQTFDINNQTAFDVDYEYGSCRVIRCNDELCAASPKATCAIPMMGDKQSKLTKETEKQYKCICNEGWVTYKSDDNFLCCYEQKSAMTALILEFIFGFGVGHFFVGNYFLGIIKASVYSVFCCSSCVIIFKILKNDETEANSFFFKFSRTICLLLCSCTYIGWQIVDSILFSIGGYTDGNGAPLFIS